MTEHHMEFVRLPGGCTDSYESTLVKTPHCWKSHVTAQISLIAADVFSKAMIQLLSVSRLFLLPLFVDFCVFGVRACLAIN